MGKYEEEDIDTLARTLYGEADANNMQDALAIACVIMNRVRLPNWPSDISEVCLQPWQFSCWNSDDPGRGRIMRVTTADPWFRKCLDIARDVVEGRMNDMTVRSTHYYASYIPKPKWARKGNKEPVYRVLHRGGSYHLFFNNIDTPPPQTPKEALDQERPIASATTVKVATTSLGAASGVAAVAETIEQLSPAMGMAERIASYSPWVVVAILAAALLYMVWQRMEDRKRGIR